MFSANGIKGAVFRRDFLVKALKLHCGICSVVGNINPFPNRVVEVFKRNSLPSIIPVKLVVCTSPNFFPWSSRNAGGRGYWRLVVNGECSRLRDLSVNIKLFVETVEGHGGGIASIDPKVRLFVARLNDDVLPSVASPGFCCARLK